MTPRPSLSRGSRSFALGAAGLIAGLVVSLVAWAGAPPRPVESTAMDAASLGLANERMPRVGVVSSGQPTEAQLRAAAAAGYRTIVNLRPSAEQTAAAADDPTVPVDEAALVESLGMRYVSIPTTGITALDPETARRLAAVLDEPDTAPVLVHCASGNRVGALWALMRHHVEGTDPETAVQDGLDAGLTRLEGPVREHLGAPKPSATD